MNPLKIVIATGIYPPSIGGPATYAHLLKNELPLRGVEVEVLSFDSVRHLPFVIDRIVYLQQLIKISRNASLIYSLDPVSVGFTAALAAKFLKKPLFLRIAGDYAWEQGVQRAGVKHHLDVFAAKKHGYGLLVWILKSVQYWVAYQADHIIVPSQYLKGIVEAWGISSVSSVGKADTKTNGENGVSGKRISVIFNSIEDAPDFATKPALRAELGLRGKEIVSAGRLVSWKGFSTLIDAFVGVQKALPEIDAQLTIIGDGPEYDLLQKKIEKLSAQASIHLLGRLTREELLKRVKAADLFVLNTWYEGFSHQILEAMQMETPIITTNICGNPEIITQGKDGLLVEYNNQEEIKNAMISMLNDTAAASAMAKEGLKKSQAFTKERMIVDLITLFTTYGKRS